MDSYRRGRQVERDQTRPKVRPRYRGILPVIWGIGAVLAFVAGMFGWDALLAVVVVMHIFFSGLIYADIKVLRRQGLDWGVSRHLWFGAALVLPFVALAYYVYSGRRIRAENDRRNTGERNPADKDDESDD